MSDKETNTVTCLQILTDVSVVCLPRGQTWPYDIHLCKRVSSALKHWILRALLLFPREKRDLTSPAEGSPAGGQRETCINIHTVSCINAWMHTHPVKSILLLISLFPFFSDFSYVVRVKDACTSINGVGAQEKWYVCLQVKQEVRKASVEKSRILT